MACLGVLNVHIWLVFLIHPNSINLIHIGRAKVSVNVILAILYSWFRAWQLYINKIQKDATVCRYLFTAKLLYMFRVSIAPIIRST